MANFFSSIRSIFRKNSRPSDTSSASVVDEDNSTEIATKTDSAADETELFSADSPIVSADDDLFGRATFADRIAHTIASRNSSESLVIAIYGPWGDGKTSTLNLMRLSLEQQNKIICMSFNPWHFGSDEQLIRAFFKTLADGLGKSLPTKAQKIGEILSEYGSVLSVAHSGVGGAATGIGQSMSNVALETQRERMESILRDSGKRVVVLIDDIDRLERVEIQAMLKLVKLSAGFDHTSYVLAFDDEWVAAAIGERYGAGGETAGRSFLEKIIQVPLNLPRPDRNALRSLVFSGVDEALRVAEIELTQEEVDAYVRHFSDGIESVVTTPRQARLYGNALSFALPTLKGEVNPVDHMLIEGIRTFLPNLYAVIRDNPEAFLKGGHPHGQHDPATAERTRTMIADAVGNVPVDPKQIGTRLLQPIFPRMASVYGNMHYGSDFEEGWEKKKKVASSQYFQRYFSYGVPPGDVPDREVDDFLTTIEQGQNNEIDELFRAAKVRGATTQLIRKLRLREDTIEPGPATTLAMGVVRNAGSLPRERSLMLDDWSFRQGAILVKKMVGRVPADNRGDLVRNIAASAELIPFACECWRWIRVSGDEGEADRLVSEEIETEMATIICERIRDAWEAEPLYKSFPGDTPRMIWYWREYGDANEVSERIRETFDAHPEEIDEYLSAHVGTAWGMENGLPHKSDFDRSCYDVVVQTLDPEYVLTNLKSRFGAELDDPCFHHGDQTALNLRIAHQFAYVHSAVLVEQQNEADQMNDNDGKAEIIDPQ